MTATMLFGTSIDGCNIATLDGCYSPVFDVTDKPIVVRAFNMVEGERMVLEMVAGTGSGEFFEPVESGCGCCKSITPCSNTMYIAVSGRYRFNRCACVTGLDPVPASPDLYVEYQPIATGYIPNGENSMSCACDSGSTVSVVQNPDGSTVIVVDGVPTTIPAASQVSAVDAGGTVILTVNGVAHTIDKGPDTAAEVAALLAFVSCTGASIPAGASLATCADLNAAVAAIPPNPTTLPPSGPAGGALSGAYPNPSLVPAAVATALAQVDCAGAPIGVGAALATCANLNAAVAAIPANPTTLPPSGPAGGALVGTYPDPGLSPAAVAAAMAMVDCTGAAVAPGAAMAACADIADAAEFVANGDGTVTFTTIDGGSSVTLPSLTRTDATAATAAAHPMVPGLSLGSVQKDVNVPAPMADLVTANGQQLSPTYNSMMRMFTNSTAAANVDASGLNHNAGVMNHDGTIGHFARWYDYAGAATPIGGQESNGTAHRLQATIPSGSTMILAPARYAGELRYIYLTPLATQPLQFLNIQAQGPGATAGFLYGCFRTSFGGDIYQKEGVSTMVLRRGEGVLLVARAGNQWNVVATAYSTLRGANYAETAPGVIQAWGASPISLGTLPPLASSTVIQGANGNDLLIGQLA